jgi:hypothetical protein
MRFLLVALAGASSAWGVVKSIHVIERSDVLQGKPFGKAGAYERIIAKVHFTADPKLPANRIITDIDLAPRNEQGLVEFAADMYVLKPRDPALGNGTALYEVSNRGRKGMIGMFNNGSSPLDPRRANEFGDEHLLDSGYTLVWLGWQVDVPDEPDLLRLYAPAATEAGKPITGVVRSEFIADGPRHGFSAGDRTMLAYPAADMNDASAQLTVRDACSGERRAIPRDAWKFGRMEGSQFVPDATRVYVMAGLEPGKIYELVYKAKNPPLVGLGPAAVRDFISYLKYGAPTASINVLGDQRRFIKRAIGFGTSQSGRFLRTFLYYGFNADEQGKKVFDGVWSHVAGGGRGSFNHRFAQPSRDGHPHMNCMYPTDIFPFTDLVETDPETGWSGGILQAAMAANVAPKVFYTNSSYEYWGRAAGLIHSTIDGKADAPLAPDTRAYFFAGTQHGPGSFPPQKNANTKHLPNGNDYRWIMRALLAGMNDWVTNGKEPPASAIPAVGKDQLVAPGAVQFPKIPGASLPAHPQRAYRTDFGPYFRTKGIVTQEPPRMAGPPYAVLVPQVDRDGNETAGIRMPMIQVPLATYTGWNLRSAAIGAPTQIFSMVGSTIYLPKTKAEREKTKDPRLSIEERYPNKEEYLRRYEAAARSLVKSGYLLEGDVEKILQGGSAQWDAAMARK